jgi:hypothetical protein
LQPLAARSALGIQEDLKKVSAPSDLLDLAHQAYLLLNSPPQDKETVTLQIRALRARLNRFCMRETTEQFFYMAGEFTSSLTRLAEDLANPERSQGQVEDDRRKALSLADILAAECSASDGCKEHGLPYFLAARTALQSARLITTDRSVLTKAAADIEAEFGGLAP